MRPGDLRSALLRLDRLCLLYERKGKHALHADAVACKARLEIELRERMKEARKSVVRLDVFRQPLFATAPCDVEAP